VGDFDLWYRVLVSRKWLYTTTGEMFDKYPYHKGLWDSNSLQISNFYAEQKARWHKNKIKLNSKNKNAFYFYIELIFKEICDI